jgi:hypothetical protein
MKKGLRIAAAVAIGVTLIACKKLEQLRGGPEEPLPAVEAEEPPGGVALEGKYAGSGTNPEGGSYTCEVNVRRDNRVYLVEWYFDGQLGYEGVGVVKGNNFVVGFAGPQAYGVVAYTIGRDGSLDGTWTAPGSTKLGTEKLKRR